MTPAAGPTLVLGADLFAAGPFAPFTFPPSRTADVGGFRLRLDGDLVPGVPSQVFATVSRDGAGVTDLQPYLGGFGKLVALREGDLAYTATVAGNGAAPAPTDRAGPAVAFTANVPSAGTYRLFLPVPCGRCHAHGRVHRADEEPMTSKIDLTIGGMTCASCANRVERKLNRLDGVIATVNYATEKAHVELPRGARSRRDSSRRSRPRATRPRSPSRRRRQPPDPAQGAARPLPRRHGAGRARDRPVDGPGSAVPRLAVGRARARRARRPLGRAGRSTARPRRNLRHGTATMDTLVSLGTLAGTGLVGRRAAARRRA